MNGTGVRSTTVKLGRQPTMPVMRVGSTTQRFFAEGEQHEAAEWTDTVLPPDDAPDSDPDTEFESFDKIPKKRSPIITLAALGACLLIGVAAWTLAFGILRTGRSVEESARALVGDATPISTTPSPASLANVTATASPATSRGGTAAPAAGVPSAAEATPSPAQAAPQQAPGEAPPSGPVVVPMAPNSPTTPPTIANPRAAAAGAAGVTPAAAGGNLSAVEVGARSEVVIPGATLGAETARDGAGVGALASNEAPAASRDTARTAGRGDRREDRPAPLRGYVWSPSAKALVPAGPSLPTTAPDFAGQSLPAPSSASAPSSSSPSSSASGARGPASPASMNHGVVAPPSTGAEPAERPAPLTDVVQPAPVSPVIP